MTQEQVLYEGGTPLEFQDEFEAYYRVHFGTHELLNPIFYRFPVGIRFEIGTGEISDKRYVSNAVFRALSIFEDLFDKHDSIYLIVNSFEDDPRDLAGDIASYVISFLTNIQKKYKFPYKSADGEFSCTRHVFQTVVKDIEMEGLIRAIVESDLGGRYNFSSSVYLLNPRNDIIYHLYDDRGLDVASGERRTLLPIYEKFESWILGYDRNRIDSVFGKGNRL